MDTSAFQLWLETAVERLKQGIDPEQIILFGSWARGTATRRSDVDLFILWDCGYLPLDRIGRVLSLLVDAPYSVEAIVYTPKELANCRDRPFIRQLLAEGHCVYSKERA